MHRQMVGGVVAFPLFVNKRLKILEAFIGGTKRTPTLLKARGSLYPFGKDGRFDAGSAVKLIDIILEGTKPKIHANVIDVGPVLRQRKWAAENNWRPTLRLIKAVEADLNAKPAVPFLKRPGG